MSIFIKNGRVIDPANGLDKKADVLIDKGKIVKVGQNLKETAKETIDASGKIVSPGFVDLHTHLREPGREDKETVETALRAAAAGGFTTLCAMPNTDPACDSQAHAKYLIERAEEVGLGNVLPIGAITKGRSGKELTEMAELTEAGCPAFSDDGTSVPEATLMRRALEYADMVGAVVIAHCEEESLAGDGVMHEGYWSTVLGMKPIPAQSESLIVERDIQLAELAGARLHIAHISAEESVDIVRKAKKRGVKVTAEAAPHHFSLTDEALKRYDTNLKVNPPLKTEEDVKAVKKGLKDGTIDAIATDHAPHLLNEKETEFDYAPFGMIGLETALSLSIMKLIDEGHLDWPELIAKLTINPCNIIKYDRGSLSEGRVADITIIDPEAEWQYTKDKIRSKSSNSPFIGWKLKGKVTDVIASGKVILKGGEFTK